MGLLIFGVILLFICLFLILTATLFLILTTTCTQRSGHDWEMKDIHIGSGSNRTYFYKCKHCKKETERRYKI